MQNINTIIFFIIPTFVYINGIDFSQKTWLQNKYTSTSININKNINEFIRKIDIPKWLMFSPMNMQYRNVSETEHLELLTTFLPFV